METSLILPGDPEFDFTLAATLPFNWQETAAEYSGDYGFVVDSQSGLMRVENSQGIREYVHGGEYDARLEFIAEDIDDEFIWVE